MLVIRPRSGQGDKWTFISFPRNFEYKNGLILGQSTRTLTPLYTPIFLKKNKELEVYGKLSGPGLHFHGMDFMTARNLTNRLARFLNLGNLKYNF